MLLMAAILDSLRLIRWWYCKVTFLIFNNCMVDYVSLDFGNTHQNI